MRSVFGWSYPPGCSGPPDDGPEPPCPFCHLSIDNCKCEPCAECGYRCLEHYPTQSLVTYQQQLIEAESQITAEVKRRSIAEAVTCEKCQKKIPRDFTDGTEWCEDCKAIVGQPKDSEF